MKYEARDGGYTVQTEFTFHGNTYRFTWSFGYVQVEVQQDGKWWFVGGGKQASDTEVDFSEVRRPNHRPALGAAQNIFRELRRQVKDEEKQRELRRKGWA
jgi:hypothetical protein